MILASLVVYKQLIDAMKNDDIVCDRIFMLLFYSDFWLLKWLQSQTLDLGVGATVYSMCEALNAHIVPSDKHLRLV